MKIDIETLKKTKGIGSKTLERIIEQHEMDNDIKSFKSEYIPSDKYKTDKDINLWKGDCLELMGHIPDKSVDIILADLPYGTTACNWDSIIPFEPLWSHYKRIIKDNGAIVLFGSEPFSTKLRMSNLDWYKYDWIWDKVSGANFLNFKYQPNKNYENIIVFSNGASSYSENGTMIYNPIMSKGEPYNQKSGKQRTHNRNTSVRSEIEQVTTVNTGVRYPKSIIRFSKGESNNHPTQKPVELLEYLIKTYTNENELVLDNTMGSGSTGLACKNTNRKFIGIELDEEYYNIAKERCLNGTE